VGCEKMLKDKHLSSIKSRMRSCVEKHEDSAGGNQSKV